MPGLYPFLGILWGRVVEVKHKFTVYTVEERGTKLIRGVYLDKKAARHVADERRYRSWGIDDCVVRRREAYIND